MATHEQNPLLNLSPEKQQQLVDLADNGNVDKLVDLVQNGDIDSVAEATGMTRREVILAGAALAAGTIGGGYTMEQLVSEVEAAASTSDSDGNVGLPGDRVDVFGETVDSNAVNTEKQDIGSVHVLGSNDDLSQAVSDHAGEVIDLAGRAFTITSQLILGTAGTTLRNGKIISDIDSTTTAVNVTADDVSLLNLDIDGNKSNNGSNHILNLSGITNCDFFNLTLENAGKHAIIADTVQYSRIVNTDILNAAEKGIFYFSGNSVYNRHTNLDVRDCGTDGIDVSSGKNMSFSQVDVRDCIRGARVASVFRISFNNCSFVHQAEDGIVIRNSDYCVVDGGCEIWNNNDSGVVLEGAQQATVSATLGSNDFQDDGGNDIEIIAGASDSLGNMIVDCSFDRANGNVNTAINEADSNQDYNVYDNLTFTGGYTTTVSTSGPNSEVGITKQF